MFFTVGSVHPCAHALPMQLLQPSLPAAEAAKLPSQLQALVAHMHCASATWHLLTSQVGSVFSRMGKRQCPNPSHVLQPFWAHTSLIGTSAVGVP